MLLLLLLLLLLTAAAVEVDDDVAVYVAVAAVACAPGQKHTTRNSDGKVDKLTAILEMRFGKLVTSLVERKHTWKLVTFYMEISEKLPFPDAYRE